MTPKLCKYCHIVMLDGFDEEARKFIEADTGGLHTIERCKEAKAKQEQKNNHGNEPEAISPRQYVERLENKFVDHTQGQKLKLKVLTSTEAEGLSLLYNTFGESHNIRFSQYQVAGSLYTIAVWYEEIKQ